MKLILSVDTEADFQANRSDSLTLKNLDSLLRFHEVTVTHGFRPTYLVSDEVLSNDTFRRFISDVDIFDTEFGAHLHPWTSPKFSPEFYPGEGLTFPSQLSDSDFLTCLSHLTQSLSNATGVKPLTYRAGRWGYRPNQCAVLSQLGYRVDLSIAPGVDWRQFEGPDTSKFLTTPFQTNGVLNIPMTIKPTVFGFLRRRWLRIFPEMNVLDLKRVVKAAQKDGDEFLVFMIHSSELHLNTSKITRSEENLSRVWAFYKTFLRNALEWGLEPILAREAY